MPAAEPQATFVKYAANQLILADGMSALITSLERYDGAVQAGDQLNASTQAVAVQCNAELVASAQTALVGLATSVDEAWKSVVATLEAAGFDPGHFTPEQARRVLAAAVAPRLRGTARRPCMR